MSLLKTWGDNSTLDFQRLSWKTAFLLAIISFERSSDLIRLDIREEFMQFNTDRVILQPISLGKTDRPTHLGSPITVLSFPEDSYVCPVLCLKHYILSSNNFRGKFTSLFIATKQPYKPVSSKTIAKWICNIIRQIDSASTAHSTRAVGSTNALYNGISLDQVLKAGDWTRVSTFQRHYLGPVNQNSITSAVFKR